ALIFFVFQVITRVPAVDILGIVLRPTLRQSLVAQWTWLVALALTAGLFEEVGRYVGYRLLMGREEKTWSKAVMYGIGHGGLESMLLVGGQIALSLLNITVSLLLVNPSTLPAAQRQTVVSQFQAVAAEPGWLPLLGGWERLWTLPVHVALSVIVLQVFRRKNLNWLWLAIGAHAAFDFVTVAILQLLGSGTNATLLVEGFIALVGVGAIWVIFALREPATPMPRQQGALAPQPSPAVAQPAGEAAYYPPTQAVPDPQAPASQPEMEQAGD
ncbi:MAG TPA: YhfC family glutamic-type intramembrane protease, partial [Ktedonobacterales bacterium]|nr:YhfC family glutamic-type intramembrane protease [Ktedonobacterales bacterium]